MEFSSYITGFTDGEGCFSISFSIRNKLKTGIEVRPSFSISQNLRSKNVLFEIQKYFKCGFIRFSASDQTYKFEVRSIQDLIKIIIPHFDKNPLVSFKNRDFQLFKEICGMVYRNEHRNSSKLSLIIEKAYQMNYSGKRKYKKEKLLKMLIR